MNHEYLILFCVFSRIFDNYFTRQIFPQVKMKAYNSWTRISDACWQQCSRMLRLLCRNVRHVIFQLWFWIH